jgi:hypothetical protein
MPCRSQRSPGGGAIFSHFQDCGLVPRSGQILNLRSTLSSEHWAARIKRVFQKVSRKPPVKYLNFFAAASERYARRRRRRFQRPVAGTCSLYGRPSGQQLRSCVVFWRGSSWGLRLCQRGVQAKAVQGSSCILRPATEGHVSGRRGVRPRAGSSHQHTNASKRQGILIRPERSSL